MNRRTFLTRLSLAAGIGLVGKATGEPVYLSSVWENTPPVTGVMTTSSANLYEDEMGYIVWDGRNSGATVEREMGQMTVRFNSQTSAPIPHNATAEQIIAALDSVVV